MYGQLFNLFAECDTNGCNKLDNPPDILDLWQVLPNVRRALNHSDSFMQRAKKIWKSLYYLGFCQNHLSLDYCLRVIFFRGVRRHFYSLNCYHFTRIE